MNIEVILENMPSLNMYYSGRHWTYRKKKKDDARNRIKEQLAKCEGGPYNCCEIVLISSYRYDLDNCIIGVKHFNDVIKELGYINDDSPKIVKRVTLLYSSTNPKATAIIRAHLYNEG
jgi:hypothetical protein